MKRPRCMIFAGVNGAGKTTFALEYLSQSNEINAFINVDLIASGISPLQPEKKQITAEVNNV